MASRLVSGRPGILYHNQDPKTDTDLWALPLAGDRTPFPVVQTPFLENEGQFSPDGRWIAYRSNKSGQDEIYVQSYPGPAGRQLVSTEGGSQPRWRRDGKELFYVAPNNTLMVVSIGPVAGQRLDTSKPVVLFRTRLEALDQPKQQYAVAPDGERFLMNVLAEDEHPADHHRAELDRRAQVIGFRFPPNLTTIPNPQSRVVLDHVLKATQPIDLHACGSR